MAFALIVLSVCTGLAEGILIKRYNARYAQGGFFFTALVSLFSMLFFLISDPDGLQFSAKVVPYSLAGGILYCSASVLTYFALQWGSFALTMLVLSYSGVFTVSYGLIFLHEPLRLFTVLGLTAVVVSLYLTRAKSTGSVKGSWKWAIAILLSFVGAGMFGVIGRMQQIHFDNRCTNEYMIMALGLSSAVLFLLGFITQKRSALGILRRGFPYAMVAGLSNGATNALGLLVATMIPISMSTPIGAGVKVVLSFAASVFLFREHLLPRQIVGVGFGILAVILLNLS